MQLREPETLCVLDHHQRRVGHVDADFDHGRGDEHVELPLFEALHDVGFRCRRQLSMQQADTQVGQHLRDSLKRFGGRSDFDHFTRLNQWAYPIRLAARRQHRRVSAASLLRAGVLRSAWSRPACDRAATHR